MDNKEFLKKLGRKIKLMREDSGFSQEKFAQKIEINQSYLSEIETGKGNPTIIYLKKISEALDTDIQELFNFVI